MAKYANTRRCSAFATMTPISHCPFFYICHFHFDPVDLYRGKRSKTADISKAKVIDLHLSWWSLFYPSWFVFGADFDPARFVYLFFQLQWRRSRAANDQRRFQMHRQNYFKYHVKHQCNNIKYHLGYKDYVFLHFFQTRLNHSLFGPVLVGLNPRTC